MLQLGQVHYRLFVQVIGAAIKCYNVQIQTSVTIYCYLEWDFSQMTNFTAGQIGM